MLWQLGKSQHFIVDESCQWAAKEQFCERSWHCLWEHSGPPLFNSKSCFVLCYSLVVPVKPVIEVTNSFVLFLDPDPPPHKLSLFQHVFVACVQWLQVIILGLLLFKLINRTKLKKSGLSIYFLCLNMHGYECGVIEIL